jgi:hypothetical protein
VKNRFQNLPFKFYLQRYTSGIFRAARTAAPHSGFHQIRGGGIFRVGWLEKGRLLSEFAFTLARDLFVVGRCTLNQVDP